MHAQLCFTQYHHHCIHIGHPFRTWLLKHKGLSFLSALRDMPNFICEACTICEQLNCELTPHPSDMGLLALEIGRASCRERV